MSQQTKNSDSIIEYILVNYRWVFVCFFLLPISFLYDIWWYFRNWIVFKISSAPRKHDAKVQHVQKQVQQWNRNGQMKLMCTARPGWQTVSFRRPRYKDVMHQVEVNLVDILDINPEKKIIRVEPLVTMGQLTATINPLGWTIPIVPEIDDLTVGGLVMGTGIESSSHRFGLFQQICQAFELVTGDGSVVRCTAEEHTDLFRAVPWSYGTVGILTAVELRIVPAKKYVRINYEPIKSCKEMASKLKSVSQKNSQAEFVEGLMFSEEEGVLMTANQTDLVDDDKVNRIGRWYKPWFFIHVRQMLQQQRIVTEYIPLRDYYHRHTRSIFWELQDIIPFGNNPVFRFLFGWVVPPKISLLKLTQTEAVKRLYENNHVIQDMLVPMDNFQESVMAFHKAFQVYPLWVCPFVLEQLPGLVHPELKLGNKPQLYVDIGVYGVPKAKDFSPKKSTKSVEKFVIQNHGFQMLYADTYMTREEFRTMFDHKLYDEVRKKWNCIKAFPEVYDKVSKAARI